jgi:hypothetical protein
LHRLAAQLAADGRSGQLEKLISVATADPSGVNIYECKRNQGRIIRERLVEATFRGVHLRINH